MAAGFAAKVELQVAYAIGHPEPVSVSIDTFGTNTVDEVAIEKAILEVFSFKPAAIIEQLDLSWSTHTMLTNQLDDLAKYLSFSKSTMELYTLEYNLGKRSLLDLLAANHDYFNAKQQVIISQSNLLLAEYRILDAMGVMVSTVLGGAQDYYAQVDLQDKNDDSKWSLDTLPIEFDVDKDHIPDNQDLCDNSLPGNNIMPYGCVRQIEDSDADGVPDDLDLCPNTPVSFDVDNHGCPSIVRLSVHFLPRSATLDENSDRVIERFAKKMKDNPNYNAIITGHTDNEGSVEENLQLSQQRAEAVKQALIARGIGEERLHAIGKGENQPIADNSTEEGRQKNRRIVIELYPTKDSSSTTITSGEAN